MIANQFPPMGGSGVQRSVKFVKYLRNFGYEPVVFTRKEKGLILKDETLLKDIPEGVEIIRTAPFDFTEWKSIFKIPGKVLGLKVFIPDSAWLWSVISRKRAIKAITDMNIKIIYTTSAPYSDHLLGLYIKKKFPDIVWVADFRDEWTNNPYTLDNPRWWFRTGKEKKMEAEVLRKADALIANTPVMKRNFVENNNLDTDNFFVIPNGYDLGDFEKLDLSKPNNEKFTLTYTGALYGRRKPDTFFKALSELISEKKIDGDKISVNLIGNFYKEKLQAQIDSFSLTGQVNIVGYVPHDECIKRQLQSDVLVLIEGTGRGADAFYTGKIFEYMNTDRPVLAILPEKGAAADLVRKTKIGDVAHTDDVSAIKNVIFDYYGKWRDNNLIFAPDRTEIEKYERYELTKKLASVFDRYYH